MAATAFSWMSGSTLERFSQRMLFQSRTRSASAGNLARAQLSMKLQEAIV